ncbi:MAG: 2TM domain-containing protein [Chitinophagaceae bacterium]|nr:2TM domain-containing protein [Chitinophagaceae bacterium]
MEPKDERLWRIARKRAGFRKSLFSCMVISAFLWGVWWFTDGHRGGSHRYPWPVWVMLVWGIAIGFQYFDAYSGDRDEMTHQEYEKLKRNSNQ